jgi:hypothetical protein
MHEMFMIRIYIVDAHIMVYYSCQHSGYRRDNNSHFGSFFLGGGISGGRGVGGEQFVIRFYFMLCSKEGKKETKKAKERDE